MASHYSHFHIHTVNICSTIFTKKPSVLIAFILIISLAFKCHIKKLKLCRLFNLIYCSMNVEY